jgi:hypothetical protein
MKSFLRFILVMAVVMVVGLGAAILLFRSFGRGALEAYLVEMRAKGEKFTFPELAASLSTNANDSLDTITNAARSLGDPPIGATNIVCQYVTWGQAQLSWGVSRLPWVDASGKTADTSWVNLSNRLVLAAGTFKVLRQASSNPAPNASESNFLQTPTPFRSVRTAAVWLSCAGLSDLHNGRRSEASANIRALASLAGLHRENHSLVTLMSRAEVAEMGLAVTWEAMQLPGWSDGDLKAMQQGWERFDMLDGLERAMEGERAMGMEYRSMFLGNGTPGLGNPRSKPGSLRLLYNATLLDNDSLYYLRDAQTRVELARGLQTNRSWVEVYAEMKKVDARLVKKMNSFSRYFYLLSVLGTPNFQRGYLRAVHAETQARLTVVAIALQRYRLKYHHPAASLQALVPEFISTVPLDCMNARPLSYRLNSDGTWTLYSVGEDGVDNGGDPTASAPKAQPGLWEGRDAVWPRVAVASPKSLGP